MVSVIIPTYNREASIKRSVISVLGQSLKDLEIIVVDDGSTDKTKEKIDQINDPRIRYIYQANKGACAARNLGIEISKGQYIAFQDSDDEWDHRKLERQMDIFLHQEDVDIVCCKTLCRRIDGSTFESMTDVENSYINNERGPIGITTQSLLMKRCVIDKIKFDINVTRYQDLDFLISAQREGFRIYCLGESLVMREIGKDSITNHPERTLDMSWYFEQKYPDIMKRKGNYLAHAFCGNLLQAGQEIFEKKGESGPYFKRALQLENSVNTYIKYVLIRTKLYPIYRGLIERLAK